jgi:hypothetical protein
MASRKHRRSPDSAKPTKRPKPLGLGFVQLEDRIVPSGIGHDHDHDQFARIDLPPSVWLSAPSGFLTGPQSGDPRSLALAALSANAGKLGLLPADVANVVITDGYSEGHLSHVYVRQQFNELEVINTSLGVHFTSAGELIVINGGFVPGLSKHDGGAAAIPEPIFSPVRALEAFASELGYPLTTPPEVISAPVGITRETIISEPELSVYPIEMRMAYVYTADAGMRPVWETSLKTPDGFHWFHVGIDTQTGEIPFLADWTSHFAATYNTFHLPIESPLHGDRSFMVGPHNPQFSPFGWHVTKAGTAPFTDTRGNNVIAQADPFFTGNSDIRPDAGPGLVFNFPFNPNQEPQEYVDALVTNLFVANNMLHDIHAAYGFTEAAGNFQQVNYTGLGKGGDPVRADAIAGSAVGLSDNAFMQTPPDGKSPRMAMFVFTGLITGTPLSPQRSSDFDNGIIIHEYGHGVSIRLTGGPANASSLNLVQSGGMGEGWSDWWTLMLTQRTTNETMIPRGLGTYVLDEPISGPGIRDYRYTFNILNQNQESFLAYGTGAGQSTQVHWTGTRWASALWDLNHLLIQKYGFDADLSTGYDPNATGGPAKAGNKLALRLVMDGLKLQPSNPTFIEARDAILLADRALTGGQNQREIWTAFARRGLGFGASTTGSTATSLTTSFDMPPQALAAPGIVAQFPAGRINGPVPPNHLTVTFSEAMDPTSFSPITDITSFTGPNGQDLRANITGFVWLNGNTTLQINFTPLPIAEAQGRYTLIIGPNILAADNGAAMDQNLNGTVGEVPGDQYVAVFDYDAVVLEVVDVFPANGGQADTGLEFIEFTFSEPVDAASLGAAGLQISMGTVTGVTQVAPNVVRYHIDGLADTTAEVPVYMTLRHGAVKDMFGFPVLQFTSMFSLDIDTVPFPVPLNQAGPVGWGAFEGKLDPLPSIGTVGDTDKFTINLAAGSRLSAVVTPTANNLRPVVDLLNEDGIVIASFTATAAGLPALLNAVPIGLTGEYTIRVSGAGGTMGQYQLQVILGAAIEAEAFGGASNNTITTAQPLAPAFTPLPGGASRASVLGRSNGTFTKADVDTFAVDLAAGQLVSIGLDHNANGSLKVLNTNGDVIATGSATTPRVINGLTVPTAGVYFVQVSGNSVANYVLTVVRNAVLDQEPNNLSGSAQPLGAATVAVGGITKTDTDWYMLNVPQAGGVLVIRTTTPGDGPGEPRNTLNPQIELFGPDNKLIIADDNSASDGRNVSIRVTATRAGMHRIRLTGVDGTTGEYVMTAEVVPNQLPTNVSAGGPYTINEGQSLTLTASATDPDGDPLVFDWDINGDGIFGDAIGSKVTLSWAELNALGITEGPTSFTVQVRAFDGFTSKVPSAPTTLTVVNVPPTGKFSADAPVPEGKPATVRFTNVFDPSPTQTAAGFRFAYDFNNDGVFDLGDGTYSGSVAVSAANVPAAILGDGPATRIVRGRVIDSGGGFTDYTTTVIVENAPPTAALTDNGPVPVGTPITVTFVDVTDPSPADVAAGFLYSFDFTGSGDFTSPGNVANSTSPSASFVYTTPGTYTVRGRVTDKDGGFNEYTRTVTIDTVAPAATFTADASLVTEGGATAVRFTGVTHPSAESVGAGFRFAYDFNNDGVFDLGDGTYSGSVTSAVADIPADILADGPASVVVRGRVIEVNGGFADYTIAITVLNAPPTATFVADPPVALGTPSIVRFVGATDPSPVDLQAGLRFSFDFDNDGDFTSPGDIENSKSPVASFVFPNPGTYTVRGRVADKDGAFTDYTTTVTVTNVPPTAEFSAFVPGGRTQAIEGDPVTLRLLEATHPSPAVLAAGLRFAFDFNNDGIFDLGDGTFAGSIAAVTASVPQELIDGPSTLTFRARVIESGGLFTDYTTTLDVLNAPPTATLVGPTTPVPATVPFTVRLDNATDPSPADVAAGFLYSFDFTGKGFTAPGNIADSPNPEATFAYPAPGFYTIRARVTDRSGGFTEYTLPVEIDVPPGDPQPVPGERWTAVGAGPGSPPQVRLFDRGGTERFFGMAFESSFTGGVRVATGDVNGDGIPDLVVGTGPGRVTQVRVLDGRDGRSLFSFQPFEETFTGGVYVAVGDVNGDGFADIAVTPDEDGGPRVRLLSGKDFSQIADFFGIRDENFRGGARAAFGDVNGDGTLDLVVAAGFGGGPRVSVWGGQSIVSGVPQNLFNDFFVFEQTLRNGVYVAAGDLNGDGFADIIVGGGPGGGPRVFALSGQALLTNQQVQLANFFAGNPDNRGGVRVTVADFDGDDRADILVGDGLGAGSRITGYRGAEIAPDGQPPAARELDAFPGFTGGVFVG